MDNRTHLTICKDMDCDVCIVGGGLNGSALALAFAAQGQRVVLIDATPDAATKNNSPTSARFDGRAYAISAGSKRMLDALNLWADLAPQAGEMRQIKVSDGRVGQGPGPCWVHFDYREIADENGSQPMGWMIEDRHLRKQLQRALADAPLVTQLQGKEVVSQTAGPSQITAILGNGQRVVARLLVGADGRASPTRERAGLKRIEKWYEQSALVCAIEHDVPHHNVAHQFFVPAGPVAILPLAGGKRSSIVWTEKSAQAGAINALCDADYTAALADRIGDFLGEIRLSGDRYIYPLGRLLAYRFVAERVALVGDAAHAMHPIAGQGLNVGLRDVAALAHVLDDARRSGLDIGSAGVLGEYQRWRRLDATALVGATDFFNGMFSNDIGVLRMARGAGLGIVNKIPALRRKFVLEAAGLTGTLPKLMRG